MAVPSRRPDGVLGGLRGRLGTTDDTSRVTSLELLFDLVFVFAITNVTGLMERHLSPTTVLEGIITLLVVWFGWCAYAWLGNQAKADEGLVRVGVIVAMAGMFFVAISVPHAFEVEGNAALVLVVGYAVVRLTHIFVYLVAAGDDRALRSVLFGMLGVCAALLTLLAVGVVVGAPAQKWWWLAAVLVDQVGVYVIGSTRWQVHSASHFAERFGLIVLIALGESIVAVGVATSKPDISWRDMSALLCGLAIAIGLWWLYFDVVAGRTEQALHAAADNLRVRLGRDSYTYGHLALVGGIVFTALGMALLIGGHQHTLGGRTALYGGIAVYLVGVVIFRLRSNRVVDRQRIVGAVLLLVIIPVAGEAAQLVQLALPAIVLITIVAWETTTPDKGR
jgi:low temperature requirement protein LtrA